MSKSGRGESSTAAEERVEGWSRKVWDEAGRQPQRTRILDYLFDEPKIQAGDGPLVSPRERA
mgnify:CR=1 FL=1